MLLISLALMALELGDKTSPESVPERAVVAACEVWWHDLDVDAPATSQSVPGNGLCLNGFIDTGTDDAILKRIAAAPTVSPLIVVIRSGGGEFDPTMNVAEALQKRRPTVIADTVCASGCANYIIVAGARRLVRDESVLAYHGGIGLHLLPQARAQIEALAKTDPKIDVEAATAQMRDMLTKGAARQDAFMVRAGVKPEIFPWMELANAPASQRNVEHCPPESHVILYSEATLARFGLKFDYYGAPRSQSEADALLLKLGRTSKVCYWQD